MFWGADTVQLRRQADALRDAAGALSDRADTLTTRVATLTWNGPDRADFESRGHEAFGRMHSLGERMLSLSQELVAQAEAQDAASDARGAASELTPGNQARDQDNPDLLGDMKDEEPYGRTEVEAEENIGSRGLEQGKVGDCWFLAALIGIADRDPQYIRDHLVRNDDGTWTVTMYKDGEPVDIIVTDEFSPDAARHQIIERDEDGNIVLDENGDPKMTLETGGWPAIYEKAAVEYRSRFGDPDYSHIEGGWGDEAYEILTPGEVERTGESDFNDIRERFESGPVTVATEHPEGALLYPYWEGRINDTTIVPRHEYNVAGFIPAGEQAPDGSTSDQDRIHLENPWGEDGGTYDHKPRAGDVYLTESEYKENFRGVSSVDMEGSR